MKDVLSAIDQEIATTERKLELLRSAKRDLAEWSSTPVLALPRAKRKAKKRVRSLVVLGVVVPSEPAPAPALPKSRRSTTTTSSATMKTTTTTLKMTHS